MWVVNVWNVAIGDWEPIEECHTYDVAIELAHEYREEGQKALTKWYSSS